MEFHGHLQSFIKSSGWNPCLNRSHPGSAAWYLPHRCQEFPVKPAIHPRCECNCNAMAHRNSLKWLHLSSGSWESDARARWWLVGGKFEDMRRGYWRLVRVGRSSLETLEISHFILRLSEKYAEIIWNPTAWTNTHCGKASPSEPSLVVTLGEVVIACSDWLIPPKEPTTSISTHWSKIMGLWDETWIMMIYYITPSFTRVPVGVALWVGILEGKKFKKCLALIFQQPAPCASEKFAT